MVFRPLRYAVTCCVNKTVINYTTHGLHAVGQDELVVLLECDAEREPNLPKDVFHHISAVWLAAVEGTGEAELVGELGFSALGMDQQVSFNFHDSPGLKMPL